MEPRQAALEQEPGQSALGTEQTSLELEPAAAWSQGQTWLGPGASALSTGVDAAGAAASVGSGATAGTAAAAAWSSQASVLGSGGGAVAVKSGGSFALGSEGRTVVLRSDVLCRKQYMESGRGDGGDGGAHSANHCDITAALRCRVDIIQTSLSSKRAGLGPSCSPLSSASLAVLRCHAAILSSCQASVKLCHKK